MDYYDDYGDMDYGMGGEDGEGMPMYDDYYGGMDPGAMADMYGDYGGMMEGLGEDQQPVEFTLAELFEQCVMPTTLQGLQVAVPIVLLCLTLRLTSMLGVPSFLLHLLSAATGLYALVTMFEDCWLFVVLLAVLAYLVLLLADLTHTGNKGLLVGLECALCIVICELFAVDPSIWHKIRGPQMVLTMKAISLGFDTDAGHRLPNVLEYAAYSFFPATVIFGPWISFKQYKQLLEPQNLTFAWARKVGQSLLLSIICLMMSACVIPSALINFNYKWVVAFRDAMSFRFSHYFISLLSESLCVASGVGFTISKTDKDKEKVTWDLAVVRPSHVELPRSLVQVVTNWNVPMHNWLKNYVYKTTKNYGSFIAYITTFIASSMLHGLNFQLAAVLLSLGVYCYIELVLRNKLATIFDSCILPRPCRSDCKHTYKKNNVFVILTNLTFSALAVFHLAYLGLMFDNNEEMAKEGYSMSHTLNKWSNLNYASHYLALATFIFYKLI